jgi:PPM family protein phosphatase
MSFPAVLASHRSFVGARSRNEDCVGIEGVKGHWCLVVSDGAGGHQDGELASRLVVDRILNGFRSRPPVDPGDLSELVLDAHDAVVAAQRERGVTDPTSAMHATVVVLVIDSTTAKAIWCHVGDSRLYLWRDGHIELMTRDDSVMQYLLDAGITDPGRLQAGAYRGALLAALGSNEEIEPHAFGPFELQRSDAFLLCSDGWWSALDSGKIELALAQAASPDQWLDAMAMGTQQRADPKQDNYSAIACWIGERPHSRLDDADTVKVVAAQRPEERTDTRG